MHWFWKDKHFLTVNKPQFFKPKVTSFKNDLLYQDPHPGTWPDPSSSAPSTHNLKAPCVPHPTSQSDLAHLEQGPTQLSPPNTFLTHAPAPRFAPPNSRLAPECMFCTLTQPPVST